LSSKKIPLSKYKKAFVDVETTGLDPSVHEIIEFAVAFEDGSSSTFKLAPDNIASADPEALKVNGYTSAAWDDSFSQEQGAKEISKLLNECILIGHNIKFDYAFIEALCRKHQCQLNISYHTIDTVSLAYVIMAPKGLNSLSLKSVCEHLGIKPEDSVHRAAEGAIRAKAVFEALASRF
jgi:DNA polymerase III alpha subunit (gram-positive type)